VGPGPPCHDRITVHVDVVNSCSLCQNMNHKLHFLAGGLGLMYLCSMLMNFIKNLVSQGDRQNGSSSAGSRDLAHWRNDASEYGSTRFFH